MAFGCIRQSVLHAVSSRRVTGSATSPRATRDNLPLMPRKEARPPVPLLEESPPVLPQVDSSPPPVDSPPLRRLVSGRTSTCTSVAVASPIIAIALPAPVNWSRRPQIDKGACRPVRQPAATSSALPRTSRASSSSMLE
eukprot:scaffold54519_cov83-Phaeocystis_antarctica.AAC.2